MSFFDFGEVIDKDTEFVIFGLPWDDYSSIKSSLSSKAPEEIRKASNNLALMTEMGYEIPKLKAVDIGDIKIESKNITKNLSEIKEQIFNIYESKKDVIPVMIGGDHFSTYPVVKEIAENVKEKRDFGILLFDAHLDLYDFLDGKSFSNATTSHRIFDLEFVNNKKLLIVGTRDNDIPEIEFARKEKIEYLNSYLLEENKIDEYVKRIIDFYEQSNIKNLYVSIDVDVLDPSIAPGTGYAIPGGFSYREMWKILRSIASKFNVIGFDLVEVDPELDLKNNLTSNLAAKLIIEFMSFIHKRKE